VPNEIDRAGLQLEFDDRFDGPRLDESKWLPYYLPQWASRERTRARAETGDGLVLRIDADQQPWAPDLDGPLRVTSLQTGVRSGQLGSGDGQLRFREGLLVTEFQPEQRLYTPRYGMVEVRAKAIAEPNVMVAMWLVGFEPTPEESGELCVMEIYGSEVEPGRALVGTGVHPWSDPELTEDFAKVELAGDATDWHDYAVAWSPGRSDFFIDGELVRTCLQAPAYPLQLMLDVYEFEPGGVYPKRFEVQRVRGWRWADAPSGLRGSATARA